MRLIPVSTYKTMLHCQNTKSAIHTARFLELEQNQDPLSNKSVI